MTRVLHVTAAYASHEGMARTATELARRVPGVEHGLCTNRFRTGAPHFAGAWAVGGTMTFFLWTRAEAIRSVVRVFRPDLVHLHGGVMSPLFAHAGGYGLPTVISVYGWAGPPSRHELRRSSISELRSSAVAQSRVFFTGMLPEAAVRRALSATGPVRGVLTQDRHLAERLQRLSTAPVRLAELGSCVDALRAEHSFERPVVVFAGRAETARGADVLIAAMPHVLRRHPEARLRLVMLPAPQLGALMEQARRSEASDAIDFVTEPVADLRSELARCTVAAFPFKFDHTTGMGPPLTVIEAMSVGLPVVVSAVRCMEPIVAARRGAIVVPPRDPVAVGQALLSALEPNRWRQLSDAGICLVKERWNWENAAGIAAELYKEVLRDGG